MFLLHNRHCAMTIQQTEVLCLNILKDTDIPTLFPVYSPGKCINIMFENSMVT